MNKFDIRISLEPHRSKDGKPPLTEPEHLFFITIMGVEGHTAFDAGQKALAQASQKSLGLRADHATARVMWVTRRD